MTPRTLLSVVGLLVVLAAGGWFVLKLLDDPRVWPPDDYVEYWAAGRLNLHGQNPYSADLLLPLERFAGRDTDEAIMMWNPPWTLTLAMPLGALPPRVGQLVWLLLGIAAVGGSAWLIWDCYGGRRDKLWIGLAVAFTFVPTLFVLNTGQISAVLLLGCALFAWCVRRGYPFAAGAAACLIAVKPHLAYLLWVAIALDAVVNRRWRIILGGVVTGVVMTAIPMAFNPDVWGQYVEAYRSSPVPPSKWVSLTPGVVLRVLLGEDKFWLQFVPMAAGVAWFAWRWKADGRRWDWAEALPWLVLVSFVTAPYGAWHFDLVLLLLPVLQRAAVYTTTSRSEGRGERVYLSSTSPLEGEVVVCEADGGRGVDGSTTPLPARLRLADLPPTGGGLKTRPLSPRGARGAFAILITANLTMFAMSHARVDSCWYAWLAPLVLAVYAGTAPRRATAPVPREVEVATA